MFNLLDESQNVQYFGQRIHRVIDEESEDEVHWVDESDQITDGITLPKRKTHKFKTSKNKSKKPAV